jgi:patatin-like phospholipase/acyl hydrolase
VAQRRILAIDGGGLRGIIPTTLLVNLEQETGKRTRDCFDFVAGTSSGAIMAAAIAAGIAATDMLKVFVDDAPRIFTQRPLGGNYVRRIYPGWMYEPQNLCDVLVQRLGRPAAGWTLNEAPIDLLISAVGLTDGHPWYFVKDDPRNAGTTGQLKLVDCAVGSSSEPTYFRPWKMPDGPLLGAAGRHIGEVVGGGVGVAGNPVYQACVEAFDYAQGYDPEETLVVSLGTGSYASRSRPNWIWPWLNWVIDELLHSPGEQQTLLVWRHYRNTLLYRLQPCLPSDISLDALSSRAILQDLGQRFATQVNWRSIFSGQDKRFRYRPNMPCTPV